MQTAEYQHEWASVKGGKWHWLTSPYVSFQHPVTSACGVEFEPHNVSEGPPDYVIPSAICRKCMKAMLANLTAKQPSELDTRLLGNDAARRFAAIA